MQPTSPSQREVLEEAVSRYEQAVSDEAAEYVLGRGLTEETALTFRLGVVADPMPGHEKFRDMLCVPYLHPTGYPLTVRFRCMKQHNHREYGHGKYMGISGDQARMFNVGGIVRAGREIHVTEGEFDAMILNQIGLPAVALPGATNWSPHYRVLLAGFSRVWVWGDPDEAGAEMVNTIARSLRQAVGVRIKDGDITDNFLTRGAGHLRSLVDEDVAA